MSHTTVYPLQAARTVALHCQGLASHQNYVMPTKEVIYNTIEELGCIQIDTLQMVHRSHYLTLWSRLGTYNTADLDALVYGSGDGANDRLMFEYWLHAACIIPLKEFRYRLPLMNRHQKDPGTWHSRWLSEPDKARLLPHVLERIQRDGGLRASDFQHEDDKRGTWWDWKPAKRALEILYNRGELMIAGRVNFQRVYDLRERVLPEWVDVTPPTEQEARAYYIERGVQAFGVCTPIHAGEYTHMKRTTARPHVERSIAAGVFKEIDVELVDGSVTTMMVHRYNLELLDQAAEGALTAERTTFLSPFDSLFWAKGRDEQFWNFRQRLEAYTPAPKREWGYFCLPILHRDQLVGRFDPKMERKTGVLRLKALYLEPGILPTEQLVADVAEAMHDFLEFHDARELVIERSEPAEFGKKLLAAL